MKGASWAQLVQAVTNIIILESPYVLLRSRWVQWGTHIVRTHVVCLWAHLAWKFTSELPS
jgi:hypothetical protein